MNTPNHRRQRRYSQRNQRYPLPRFLRLDYDTVPLDNLSDAINKQTNNHKIAKSDPDSVEERQLVATKKGNKTAKIGLWVNGVLGGFGIVAIIISALALHAANKSADAAIKQDSIVASQFEIEKRPYVFASGVKTDTLKIGKQEWAKIYLKNFGVTPAIIIYCTWKFSYDTNFVYPIKNFQYVNRWSSGENVYVSMNTGDIITKNAYDSILSDKYTMYAHGEAYFKDVITEIEYEYDYCYKIFPDGRYVATFNHNGIHKIKADSLGFKPGYANQLQDEADKMKH